MRRHHQQQFEHHAHRDGAAQYLQIDHTSLPLAGCDERPACGSVSISLHGEKPGSLPTMIEIQNLTKRFGSVAAVSDLSLIVRPGEVLGFLGPNGAGKSTTMKMATGYLAPDQGTVSICGHDIVSDTLAAQRRLGYLPEGAPAYGELTPREFQHFIAGVRNLTGADARAAMARAIAG